MSNCPWAFCFIDSCSASKPSDALVHCCNPEFAGYNALLNIGHLWVLYVPPKHEAVRDAKHKNDKTEVAFQQADFNLRWDSGKYLRMKSKDNYWVRSKCFLRKSFSLKEDAEDWRMYFWVSDWYLWHEGLHACQVFSWEKGKFLYVSQIYKVGDKWYKVL